MSISDLPSKHLANLQMTRTTQCCKVSGNISKTSTSAAMEEAMKAPLEFPWNPQNSLEDSPNFGLFNGSFCKDSMRLTVSRNIWKTFKILCPILAMWVINNICHYISGWFGIKEKHTAQHSSIECLKTHKFNQITVNYGTLFGRLHLQASQVIAILVGN